MADYGEWRPLGEALQSAVDDALKQWILEHAKSDEGEVTVAEEVTGYTITFTWQRRRPSYCYVEVLTRRPWKAATYGYRVLTGGMRTAAETVQRVV